MTKPQTDELLPCPFCGSSDVTIITVGRRSGIYFQAFCMTCVSCGPEKSTRRLTVRAWNTRTSGER